jgi:MerR family transcriptional regulator, copper efflux regulator
MQIGTVAKTIGVSVDAIRFYERNALLPPAPRTPGGFRLYGENDLETLAFVRRAQHLGFKLSEIRGLLSLRGNRLQPCAPVRRRLREKLLDVQRKLSDLHRLEHELRLALRSCDRQMRKRPAHCPILSARARPKPGTLA